MAAVDGDRTSQAQSGAREKKGSSGSAGSRSRRQPEDPARQCPPPRATRAYVAQIAMGASAQQTVDAFLEAEAHEGPSIIIAYSPLHRPRHQHAFRHASAEARGRLRALARYRYRPAGNGRTQEEFVLDSVAPSIPLKTYAYTEIRYKMLSYTQPEEARQLLELAQEDVDQCWRVYSSMAERWPAASRRGQGEPGSHVGAPVQTV